MENKNSIRVSNRISPTLLLFAFFWLIILPAMFLTKTYTEFSKTFLKTSLDQSLPKMKNEMMEFKEELKPEVWLTKQLKTLNENINFVSFSENEKNVKLEQFSSIKASSLAKIIQKKLKLPVSALIYHGPDTNEISTYKNKSMDLIFRFPPKTLLRRAMASINRQYEMKPIKFFSTVKELKRNFTKLPPALIDQKHKFLFQTAFGTIHPFKISPGIVFKTISARFGKTGPLFFFYQKATIGKEENEKILGGYLVIFRLQDISPERIIADAKKANSTSIFKRHFIYSKKSIGKIDDLSFHISNQLFETKSFIQIKNVPSGEQMVHLIQRGTIVTKNLNDIKKHFPYLSISLSKKHLRHWLDNNAKDIFFLVKLLVLAALFFIVRIHLFGLDFKASIKVKILLASFTAGILPISTLGLNLAMNQQLDLISQEAQIKQQLETEQALITEEIQEELNSLRNRILFLSVKLESSKNNRIKILQNWLNESCADEITVSGFDGESFSIVSPNAGSETFDNAERTALNVFSSSVVALINRSEVMQKNNVRNESQFVKNLILSNSKTNAQTANLTNQGELAQVERGSPDFMFSSFIVYSRQKIPDLFVIIRFNTFKLIQSTLKRLIDSHKLASNWRGFSVENFLLVSQSSKTNRLVQFYAKSSKPINLEKISEKLNLVANNRMAIHFENLTSDGKQFLYAKKHEMWPITFISKTTIPKATLQKKQRQFFPILLFLISLCGSILIFAQILYVKPLEELIKGLQRIANGDLNSEIYLQSSDELETLAQKLNRMRKGLKEKDKLSQYISSDVLKEIEESENAELKPGGERITAAILFLGLVSSKRELEENYNEQMFYLEKLAQLSAESSHMFHGIIDKIVDNSIMIVFREQGIESNLSLLALKATKLIISNFEKLCSNKAWLIKAGIDCGEVVSGKLGSLTGKLDYTVIGDSVNTAARLKSIHLPGSDHQILLTRKISNNIPKEFNRKTLGAMTLKGKTNQVEVVDFWENKKR